MEARIILLACALSLFGSAQAADMPTGATVAAGTASMSQTGNTLTVTSSNRAIINWNSFSIGAGNTVLFNQPSTSSAVLNRVLGGDRSFLNGTLASNGQVFLLNPNGISVGVGGNIQASGIYLSTASIADGDFVAGNLQFQAPPTGSSITVSAEITASDTIDIRASSVDLSGASLNAPVVNVNNGVAGGAGGGLVPPQPGLLPGGNITLSAGSGVTTSGSFSLASGLLSIVKDRRDTQQTLQQVGGRISVTGSGSTAPVPTPSAPATSQTAAASLPARGSAPIIRSSVGLIDGAVTVRMPLVNVSPISLR